MRQGYIKIWRKALDNEWLKNHKLWVFWCYCLLKASHKKHMVKIGYQDIEINPGQFIFGRKKASIELKIHESSIQRCIYVLKKMGNIEIETNNKFSVITIINWDIYQSDECHIEQQSEQQANNKRTHTRMLKNVKNKYIADFSAEIYQIYLSEINPKQKSRSRALKNISSWLTKQSKEDLVQAIKNYKSVCSGRNPEHRKDPANFFGVNEVYHIDYLPENFIQSEDKCNTPNWL